MDLKIKDVAELLKVSETTIRRWLFEGKIPGYKLNCQYRFSRHEIESWMIKCKLKPEAEEGFHFEAHLPAMPLGEESLGKGGKQQFLFYRSLHQGGVFSEIPGETKEAVIRGTTECIASRLGVDVDLLAELLLDREQLMPTALNRGVAVPHTRDFVGKGLFDRVFVVYPQSPLVYGALDGKRVHCLFFLFASSDKSHLHLLAKIAHFCSAEENLAFLQTKPEKLPLLEKIRLWESDSTAVL